MRSQKLQGATPSRTLVKRGVLAISLTVATLSLFGITTLLVPASANAATAKMRLATEPAEARVNQVYFNTTDKREYIYNGQEWVPHDASIDTYVLKKDRKAKTPKAPSIDNAESSKKANQGVSQ